ncbi:Gfo/Idh/MocA family oxidoreductase [Pseudoalteromonas xiamenensis]|uniref:Gfo/Idh/MocA family protein n=1 Tax=Pseudoalteromonas xiamenensis TaxID=882626 RepID=UPI0027E54A04|nr:Gfo/Idh/MocA family oxidoreductase [Pseudoalteromonas xiamenensis]WMN59385.1 Gfo/Idh/MocA family oxidoreductase [Pseudoalteromonas xiamenensis]
MNILVFGYGNIAIRHIRNLLELTQVKHIDIVRATLAPILEDFKVTTSVFSDVHSVIDSKKFHLALICSPTTFHFEHLEMCFKRNIPCLVEKPISLTEKQSCKLLKLHRENPVPVLLGYDIRFTKGYAKISSILREQQVGEIWKLMVQVGQYLPSWRTGKDYRKSVSAQKSLGGGVLRELSHEIDYLIGLFEIQPEQMFSILINNNLLDMDCENYAQIIGNAKIAGQNSTCGFYISLDMLSYIPKRKLLIQSDKLDIEWDLLAQSILVSDGRLQSTISVEESTNQPYVNMMQLFLSKIEKSDLSNHALEQGNAVMQFIEEIERGHM